MNKDRRASIADAIKLVEQARTALEEARDMIGDIRSEEQEYYDNMPPSFQEGDKGTKVQEAIDALDNAHSPLDEIDFDDIVSNLETAAE